MNFLKKHLLDNSGNEHVSKTIWLIVVFVVGAASIALMTGAFNGKISSWYNGTVASWFNGDDENPHGVFRFAPVENVEAGGDVDEVDPDATNLSASLLLKYGLSARFDVLKECKAPSWKNAADLSITVENADELRYGSVEMYDNYNAVYTPNTLNWTGFDTIKFAIVHDGKTAEAIVNMVPATSIYYEENFINPHDGNWTEVSAYNSGDTYEYGQKDPYANNLQALDSQGTSIVSNVKAGNETDFMHTFEFSFTGTGIDVSSRTSDDSGTIFMQIKNSANKVVKTFIVNTTYKNGAYYQIPVIHCTGLPYDTYCVIFKAYYDKVFDAYYKTDRGGSYNVYLDGIRIYNPLGAASDITVDDIYAALGEKDKTYNSVRTALLNAGTWDLYTDSNGVVHSDIVNGKTYVTSIDTEYAVGGVMKPGSVAKNATFTATAPGKTSSGVNYGTGDTVNVYDALGPKSEAYLANGDGLSIPVVVGAHTSVSVCKTTGNSCDFSVYDTRNQKWVKIDTVVSSTEVFYDVSDYVKDGYLIVKSTSNNGGILSLRQYTTTS